MFHDFFLLWPETLHKILNKKICDKSQINETTFQWQSTES